MTTLDNHKSSGLVKMLYIGSSGTGKTGSLVSLVPDYDLRILDLDNGLPILRHYVMAQCPERISSIEYEYRRDRYKAGPTGPTFVPPAKAYREVSNLLDKWSDGTTPEEWGPDKILVLDSMTNLGKAAFNWAKALNPSAKDPRQWYKTAQDALDEMTATLTSDDFNTNVIVTSHIDFIENESGVIKGYASTIGKALGPKIPRNFNTLIMADSKGAGKNARRLIRTVTTGQIDLKTEAPMKIDEEYPLETGLGDIFKKLRVA